MSKLTARQKVEELVMSSNNMHDIALLSCFNGVELSQRAREALDRRGHLTVVEALTKAVTFPEDKSFFEDITILSEVECLRVNFLFVLWPFYGAALSVKE